MIRRQAYELHPNKLGCLVKGLDLKQKLSADTVAQIKKDVTDHRLLIFKVRIFWEGHKNWKNVPLCFDVIKYVIKKRVRYFFQTLWPSHNIGTLRIKGLCLLKNIWKLVNGLAKSSRPSTTIQNLLIVTFFEYQMTVLKARVYAALQFSIMQLSRY